MSDMSNTPRVAGDLSEETGLVSNLRMLADVPVRMSVEVGSTQMRLTEVLSLGEGSVVELDRQADELLDIMVNGTLVARGEIVTVNGRYGIRVVETVSTETRLAGLERRA